MDDFDPANPDPADDHSSQNAPQSHEVRHSQVSAVVPEEIAAGVYSTGTMILQGQHEFIIDFLLRLGKPHQLVARVILPHSVIPSLIRALKSNLSTYEAQHLNAPEADSPDESQPKETAKQEPEQSAPPEQVNEVEGPTGPGSSNHIVSHDQPVPPTPPSHIEELYHELKISSAVMTGTYSNAVLIGHSQNELSFDFITTFYPRSTVSCRVHTAIPTAQRLLESLIQAHGQFQQRQQEPPNDQNG